MPIIGTLNETSLHNSIKNLYANERAKLECEVDGYVIDVVRGKQLIEIQTKNFSAIRNKLYTLAKRYPLTLVYPLIVEKRIVTLDSTQSSVIRNRCSPKKGRILDIFRELIYIPQVVKLTKFSLEVIGITVRETRIDDGKGSWRRKGISIRNRELLEVVSTSRYSSPDEYLSLLPPKLPKEFSTKLLKERYGFNNRDATQLLYFLSRIDVIKKTRKVGNLIIYSII